MGNLQKNLFQKKLRDAEASLGLDFNEDTDGIRELHSHREEPKSDAYTEDDNYPKWSDYFEENRTIADTEGNQFNYYFTRPGSVDSPIYIFHHGAGSSALSFALLGKQLIDLSTKDKEASNAIPGLIAIDARGHGKSFVTDDFSIESFVQDAVFLISQILNLGGLENHPIFLVGHSLGGSILTKASYRLKHYKLRGLCMLDIVEDTAVSALLGMHSYLQNLPQSFPSLSRAVDWHISSSLLRNKPSALISVPSYLKLTEGVYKWRTDLNKTSNFWKDWFTGLSKEFVDAPTSKLLILAGTDNLDKQLMIGQMQGKYQLVVFQDSGHFIQEDVPRKTAITLIDFWKRNDRANTPIISTWGSKK